ncbi:MAG: AroM family protein [Vicinamibacteria bacterium]
MERKRAAFIAIGQSPRPDIVEEMRPWWGAQAEAVEVEEHGVLDGLSREEIDGLAPEDGDVRLVSRLRDGTEVLLGAHWVHDRVQDLVASLGERKLDLIVLLCTGRFPGLQSKTLLVKAGPVVDHGLAAFAATTSTIGVLVPHETQKESFRCDAAPSRRFLLSHASPYSGNRWEDAANEIEGADIIVMHCMGYDERMRRRMAELTGKPCLLARRLVAAATAQVI